MAGSIHPHDGVAIVEADGELDIFAAPKFRRLCAEAVDAGYEHVAIDLGRVTFMDSSGLAVIVGALKRVRARGGRFSLICDRPQLLDLFRTTGLTKVFTIYPSTEDLLGGSPPPPIRAS